MRFFLPSCFLAVSCVLAQQQSSEIITITPDTVIAVVNGENFTAGDFERISHGLTPQFRSLAAADPKKFFEEYAHSLMLAREGEKAKLHEAFPYKQRIEDARRQILADAIIQQRSASIVISPEQIEAHYKARAEDYREAAVKVIFLSRIAQITNLQDGKSKSLSVEEIKAKANEVAKLARDGKDFVELAKEHSDDRTTADKGADLPAPIRAGAANIPWEMRSAVLQAKPGDVVGPIEHATGFYIFRVEEVKVPPLAALRKEIEKELREAELKKWLDEVKAQSSATLTNDAFWTTFKAANQTEKRQQEMSKDSGETPQGVKSEPKSSETK